MSGFTTVKHGSIEIKHYSTSRMIELRVFPWGVIDDVEHLMLSYSEFDDLKEVLKNPLLNDK